jgi:hypothetical protein
MPPGITKQRPVDNLVIIDAPEKIQSLAKGLALSGMKDFEVFAIGDAIYGYPKSTLYSGIDRSLNETGRFVLYPELVSSLTKWANTADRVVVATDADMAGDALAVDIVGLLQGHGNVGRARVRALDPESLGMAFSNVEPVRTKDGWPYLAQRTLGRLVECAFAVKGARIEEKSYVNRSISAVLGVLANEERPFAEVTLALPAEDGRDSFYCSVRVNRENQHMVEDLLAKSEEFVRAGKQLKVGESKPAPRIYPWGYSETLLRAARLTDRSILEVNQSIMRLYSRGLVSYPMSEEKTVSSEGIGKLIDISSRNGLRFEPSKLSVFSRYGRHSHEALRPLDVEINISKPMGLSDPDMYVLSLITRNLLSCGMPFSMSKPDPASLPDWAKKIGFKRLICQRARTWATKPMTNKLRSLSPEEIILSVLVEKKIGYPFAWAQHIENIISSGLVDSQGRITAKGAEWFKRTPPVLLNPLVASQIDAVIAGYSEKNQRADSLQTELRRVIEHLGLWEKVFHVLEE